MAKSKPSNGVLAFAGQGDDVDDQVDAMELERLQVELAALRSQRLGLTSANWTLANLTIADAARLPRDAPFTLRLHRATCDLRLISNRPPDAITAAMAAAEAGVRHELRDAAQAFLASQAGSRLDRLRARLSDTRIQLAQARAMVSSTAQQARRVLVDGGDPSLAEASQRDAEAQAQTLAGREKELVELVAKARAELERELAAAVEAKRRELLPRLASAARVLEEDVAQLLAERLVDLAAARAAVVLTQPPTGNERQLHGRRDVVDEFGLRQDDEE